MTSSVGVVRCLAAAALFGATVPAASKLVDSVPAVTLAGILYIGAALATIPMVVRRPPRSSAVVAEWRPVALAVSFGGGLGPALLFLGLERTSAASASLLLNLELAATVALASVWFREHVGGRVLAGAALVSAAGVVLVWEPGATVDGGAMLIAAACVCWAVDNVVTARISQLEPEHVVAVKGSVAGGVNLVIGLAAAGVGAATGVLDVVAALLVGAAGYGLSMTLWVKGARDLGAARAQVVFATAPFLGAAVAWAVLGDTLAGDQAVAMVLAASGVLLASNARHDHLHRHTEVVHTHEHGHDDHHDHHGTDATSRHSHEHRHVTLAHSHGHVPDLHHGHDHRG